MTVPETAPFEGLRVVDLSDRVSGAFAARLFGDFGADVVLAEPAAGHALRHEPPFLDDRPGPERGALHAYLNWNKRSLVVEVTGTYEKVDAFERLVRPFGLIEMARTGEIAIARGRGET